MAVVITIAVVIYYACVLNRNVYYSCNPKVLLESPKMVRLPKVVRRGCKRSFEPRERKRGLHQCKMGLHRWLNGFRMVQKTLGRLLLPELKLPFAPSPNHFWEFTIFGLSSRTFGLQYYSNFFGN